MTPASHIHVYLLSGFLGAGKTTLLQRFLTYYSYRKNAVLKNEVGEVNIDAQLMQKMGVHVVEIANGSIFCTCRHDTFIDAMKQLATYPIDMLFIECSGIADPASFGKDVMLLLGLVGPVFHHLGNICLVDATSFLELVDLMPAVESQVKYSNFVLLNKIDLVASSDLPIIERKIREINKKAIIYRTQFAELDFITLEGIIGPLCGSNQLPLPVEGSNSPKNKPFTIALNTKFKDKFLDPDAILNFFQELAEDTLRIKGFFQGSTGWMYVDGVQSKIVIKPLDITPLGSEIVVIFRPGVDPGLIETVQKAWNQKFGEKK